MNLSEIIGLCRQLYLDDFVTGWETDDEDLLWSNAELTALANEAELEITERQPIHDNTTAAICKLPIVAGTVDYAIDPRIVYVKTAVLDSLDEKIEKTDTQYMDNNNVAHWRSETGEIKFFISDLNSNKIRVIRIPVVDDGLTLEVARRPLAPMVFDAITPPTPEVNAAHHNNMVHWIAYKAFLKQDAETHNSNYAKMHHDIFVNEVGPRLDVTRQTFRNWAEGRRPRTRSYY